jgi:NADH:ubiquinone oxidoreductase subunit 6 (subunit J)
MASEVLFYLFAGLAIASAVSMVWHRNPLYSAISLVGVFIALSCIYVTLAAPFIAAVQILIYAGAIMVLVVFVIMLLNLDEDKPLNRLRYLYAVGGGLGLILLVQTFFIFYAVSGDKRRRNSRQNIEYRPGDVYRIFAACRDRRHSPADGDSRRCRFGKKAEPAAIGTGRRGGIGTAKRGRRKGRL